MLHTLLVIACALAVFFTLFGSIYIVFFAVLGSRRKPQPTSADARTRFLVFVPAHNEGAGIQPTLRSILRANYPQQQIRIVALADNCTDDTSDRARIPGIEVWTRNDPSNRGKGHALKWAFERIDFPFDLAVIVDADTEVDPAFFSAMDSGYCESMRRDRPDVALQGRYLFAKSAHDSSWFERFTIASKSAENSFIHRPRTALGLANLIQGNGFCVSRSALARIPFTATSIVEDAEYSVTLALNCIQVVHIDDARVVSRMTRSMKAAATQRLRWASGAFALFLQAAPQLFLGTIRQRRWQLAEMALMLVFTSRVILVYAVAASVALLGLLWSSALFPALAGALALSLLLQLVYLYMVLRKADDSPVPFQTIAFMPFYFGFLGAMQLGAVLGVKRKQWNRTHR